MKRIRNRYGRLAIALLCAGVVGVGLAEDLAIQSFNGTGQLTFNTLNDGTSYTYRVEWASTPGGPWTNTWTSLVNIPGSGIVTCSVPMCYRVVASLGDYMVVDVSGGTSATSYAVNYYRTLADVPGGAGNDAYTTTNLLFRLIPNGTFTMGSPAGELGRAYAGGDETQHQETLTQPFYIGVFEVTQKQWERVMGTWPSFFNNASYRESRPVEQVSYSDIRGASAGAGWPTNSDVDADSFMGRLRARTGKAFDLPTETQWEYAGRAGTTTALNSGKNLTDVYQCPNMDEVGRYWRNGGEAYIQNGNTSVGSANVGSYLPNTWGLYDIHGNVFEWCLEWLPGYEGFRVVRGGAWGHYAYNSRVAFRGGAYPVVPDNAKTIGFRLLCP